MHSELFMLSIEANPSAARAFSFTSAPVFRKLLLIFLISAVLLIPCFWQAHIEAGDLGSHVYNAWLAELIQQGRAPGLYTVAQWDNVLLDVLLLNLAKVFGFVAAERIATSLCVLIFFWGVFLFLRAISGQDPWFLTPLLAMLSYGALFHMGFLNYYTSVGLGCIGLSLLWSGRRNGVIAGLLLAPIILLAHALGFVLFVGIGCYRLLWRKSPAVLKWLLPTGVLLLCISIRWYVAHHPSLEVHWRNLGWWHLAGFDQFHVFGLRYKYFARAVFLIAVISTGLAVWEARDRREFWRERRLPLELYFLSFLATALLPEEIHPDHQGGWVGAVAARLTLMVAIFAIAWLATLPRQKWQLIAYAAVASVFSLLLYQDSSYLNRMEANTEQLTRQLPFGTRVLATIHVPDEYHVDYVHIYDRACIHHCFLFSNYEPSSKQFRIRVHRESPIATASVYDALAMQSGTYTVQQKDLPLKQIYQCDGRDLTQICIRDLGPDEKNGRVGYNPQTVQASTHETSSIP
jgi:hypothetical protein